MRARDGKRSGVQRTATARGLADEVQRFLDGDRDLERRRELAASHASRAMMVFAERGDDGRAEAMREAGRAIALDPHNRDAQRLLAQLLLEPPKTVPAAAREKIEQEREAAGRGVLRASRWGYIPFLFLVPAVAVVSGRTWPFVPLELLMLFQLAIFAISIRFKRRIPRAIYILLVINHCAMLAWLGLILGPLLLSPLLIFGTLTIMLLMPAIRIPSLIVSAHALAVAIPLALEWLHVVPSSYRYEGNALVFEPWAVQISPHVIVLALIGTIALQMTANTYVFLHQRSDQERAQELVHVQTWQLAQLVETDDKVRP